MRTNIMFVVLMTLFEVMSKTCDTTILLDDGETVDCIISNCPTDSIVTTIENGRTTQTKIYRGCKDQGDFYYFGENGDTLTFSHFLGKKTIGQRRMFYSANHPKRFTNFSSTGQKDGWEVFWYSNGNVKDSILFRNDSTIARSSFYLNGRKQVIERDIYGPNGYSATSYTPKGKKNGAVINGTGAISVCDSIGANCHTLTFKNGKRVFE
jgi:antitoxin component YwqK of YwqJK toxin-antitoxin module